MNLTDLIERDLMKRRTYLLVIASDDLSHSANVADAWGIMTEKLTDAFFELKASGSTATHIWMYWEKKP